MNGVLGRAVHVRTCTCTFIEYYVVWNESNKSFYAFWFYEAHVSFHGVQLN